MTSLLTLIFKWIGISNDHLFKDVHVQKRGLEREGGYFASNIFLPPFRVGQPSGHQAGFSLGKELYAGGEIDRDREGGWKGRGRTWRGLYEG